MEPVTHFLAGAAIARTGLNRKTALATLAATLAAEAADLDILWNFAGPVESLKHHRGITHTLIGTPVVALAVVGFVWLLDRYWLAPRRAKKLALHNAIHSTLEPGETPPASIQKIHYGWLFLTTLIAASSHILLDFTNNYGVRPFFPFNPHWYSADIVFIAEPLLWLVFALAFLILPILNLTDKEIGIRKRQYNGQLTATLALLFMLSLWTWRFIEHTRAQILFNSTQVATEPVLRVAFMPYPINPWRWHAIIETPHTFQTAELNTRTGTIETDPQYDVIQKPEQTPAVQAAKQTELGKVYLDWASWAIVRDLGPEPIPLKEGQDLDQPRLLPPHKWTTVRFDDLRFGYDFRGSGRTESPASLTGWVYIVDNHEDAGQAMGMKVQH